MNKIKSKETGEQQQFLSDDQGQFKLDHWLTAEEMREAGEEQKPARVTLARIRRRLPIAGFPSLYFRVN